MSYYENRIKALEEKVAEMAKRERMKAIPIEVQLLDSIARLKAEVERLRKAGDAMVDELQTLEEVVRFKRHQTTMDCRKENPRVKAWNAAKEGKPSV